MLPNSIDFDSGNVSNRNLQVKILLYAYHQLVLNDFKNIKVVSDIKTQKKFSGKNYFSFLLKCIKKASTFQKTTNS